MQLQHVPCHRCVHALCSFHSCQQPSHTPLLAPGTPCLPSLTAHQGPPNASKRHCNAPCGRHHPWGPAPAAPDSPELRGGGVPAVRGPVPRQGGPASLCGCECWAHEPCGALAGRSACVPWGRRSGCSGLPLLPVCHGGEVEPTCTDRCTSVYCIDLYTSCRHLQREHLIRSTG